MRSMLTDGASLTSTTLSKEDLVAWVVYVDDVEEGCVRR